MPRRKRFRRNVKKKKPRSKISTALTRYPFAFPNTRKVKMLYTFYGNLSQTSSAADNVAFKPNSAYDCYGTGAGGQPRTYDQMLSSTLYTKYRVDHCKYLVKFRNKAATDALVSVGFLGTNTYPSTTDGHMLSQEQRYRNVKQIGPNTTSRAQQTFSGMVPINQILGVTRKQYMTDGEDFKAAYNADPTHLVYMNLCASDNPQDDVSCDVDYYIRLTLYCTLSNFPNTVNLS